MNVAGVVLAAGRSSRLGSPKQLVRINGESLVSVAVQKCFDAGCFPVVVVVGCAAKEVSESLARLPVVIVQNPDWSSGQASSIVVGIQTLVNFTMPRSDAALVMLCDMPKLVQADLFHLIDACRKNAEVIVATRYPEGGGVPACFPNSLYPSLLRLTGDCGAKQLIRSNRYSVLLCNVGKSNEDVDVPCDLAHLYF